MKQSYLRYKMFVLIFLSIIICLVDQTYAVINDLDESEYQRMPPIFHLDDYGQCMEHPGAMYCSMKLDLYAEPHNEVMKMIEEYSELRFKHFNHSYLDWGICVMKTCNQSLQNIDIENPQDLNNPLEACLDQAIAAKYGLRAKLSEIYHCELKDKKTPIDKLDWIALILLVAVLSLNLIGTLNDMKKTKDKSDNRYIKCFSIVQNWKTLTEPEHPKDLRGINGLKTIAAVTTTSLHVLLLNAIIVDNAHEVEKSYEKLSVQLAASALLCVHVFFVISGGLLMYSLLCSEEKKPVTWKDFAKKLLVRWSRLTPAYMMIVLLQATWMRHASFGPVWNMYITAKQAPDCRKYLWQHLFYVHNYAPDDLHCAVHTWYVPADFQLYILSLVMFLCTKRQRRLHAVAGLWLLGALLPALHAWLWDLDAVLLAYPEFMRSMKSDVFHYSHAFGHNNIACYAMGLATGYFVYHYKKYGLDLYKSKWAWLLSFLVVPGILGNVLVTSRLVAAGGAAGGAGGAAGAAGGVLYAAVHRTMYGVPYAAAFFLLVFPADFFLTHWFRLRIWAIPGRLSYSLYLVHVIVIYVLLGSRHSLISPLETNMGLLLTSVLATSFLLAVPMFLLIEEPFNRVMRTYLDGPKKEVDKKNS